MKTKLEQIYNKKYGHIIVLAYYFVIMAMFFNLERTTKPLYFMHSRIDDYIPFLKGFIIPYLFWFVFIFIAVVYFFFKSKPIFTKLLIQMFAGMTICCIIYFIFPNGQNLRPGLVGDDFLTNIIRFIYGYDTPTDSAPSMHVINAIAVFSAVINYNNFKYRKTIVSVAFISMLLIIISTVFVKQHSILDVFYGVIIAVISHFIIYKYRFFRNKSFNSNVENM